MNNEPIRHHYIPQFIIKNFSEDRDGFIWFYTKSNDEISLKHCSEVFVAKNLYKDLVNNPDNPTKIERDLGVFEREISQIINKFLVDDDIQITYDESEKIKYYFGLMNFRSLTTRRFFESKMSEESKEFYSFYQEDGSFTDFWKRNLGYLVNCRSIEEVIDNKNIDEPIKSFMIRDSFGVFGLYLILCERRGEEDFFLSDIYPLTFDGITPDGKKAIMYHIVPISPKRALIIAANGICNMPISERIFDDNILKMPIISNGKVRIRVKKIYQDKIEWINEEISKHYHEAAFLDKNKFVKR